MRAAYRDRTDQTVTASGRKHQRPWFTWKGLRRQVARRVERAHDDTVPRVSHGDRAVRAAEDVGGRAPVGLESVLDHGCPSLDAANAQVVACPATTGVVAFEAGSVNTPAAGAEPNATAKHPRTATGRENSFMSGDPLVGNRKK